MRNSAITLTEVRSMLSMLVFSASPCYYFLMVQQTDRLLLLPITKSHIQEIFTHFTKEITTYMYPSPATDESETRAFVQNAINQREQRTDYVFAITHKPDGEFLGLAGLHNLQNEVPELGIWTKREAHGHHYGREAIGVLITYAINAGIPRLRYPVDRRNTASKKIPLYYGGLLTETREQITPDGRTL